VTSAKTALAFALAGIFVMPFQSSAADSTGKPLLLHMQAALDIDRTGHVTAITYVDDGKIPDAIRQRGEQVARGWKFLPPVKEGQAVSGRTYVGMQACIVPRADSIDFSIVYARNGPASFYRAPKKPRPSALPIARLVDQGVNSLRGKIVYVVSVDGKAQLESATLDDPKLQEQYGRPWRVEQRELLKSFRFRAELIDGTPTATRVETIAELEWFRAEDRKAAAAEMQARHEQSDACKALRNDNGRQIASNSPFKRIEG
jgi:hypothetical protein